MELARGIWWASIRLPIDPLYSHSVPPMLSGIRFPFAEECAFGKSLDDRNPLLGCVGDPMMDSGGLVVESSSALPESRPVIAWKRD